MIDWTLSAIGILLLLIILKPKKPKKKPVEIKRNYDDKVIEYIAGKPTLIIKEKK